MIYKLVMGGGCILSIAPCQPLHAVGYPFDCPNIVYLMLFPNINQTPKQNYPSQLETISWHPKEHELDFIVISRFRTRFQVFLNTYLYTNLTYNVIYTYLIIW